MDTIEAPTLNADSLVLKWVESKLPQWFNEKIEARSEWLERSPGSPSSASWRKELTVLEHLRSCSLKRVVAPTHTWGCGCYSEYTRDDAWVIHAHIVCGHMLCHEYYRDFHGYDVPDVLEELFQLDESECPYREFD